MSPTDPLLKISPTSYNAVDASTPPSPISDPDPPQETGISKDRAWILASLYCAVFLGALGNFAITSVPTSKQKTNTDPGTVVATLITPIGSDFNKSNEASYIGTSYLLSLCCFTPLYGRLADILGRKSAMLLALFFFGSGTILCGLVPSMETLILARAVAGMGGGGVMTVSTIVTTDLIPLKQRGLYQGLTNILFGLGAGIGGPLGGWINDAYGWRSAFYFQAPLLIFSATMVAWKVNIRLPSEIQDQPLYEKLRRIDVLGSLTLVGFVGCLLLAFSLKSTEELPWSHPLIYGLFTASMISGVSFVLVEKYWAFSPVMPLHLLTQRTPFAVSISNLFASMTAFSMLYNVPLYLSAVKLYSSTSAGSHLIPHSIAIPCGSVAAGWLMRRTGKLYTLTVAAAATSLFANILVIFWNENTAPWHLWADLIPQAFGMASFITSTLIAMIAGVSREDMPVATGITYLFRTTGQVLGVSLSGAILQAVLLRKLRDRIHDPHSAEIIYEIRHSAASIPNLPPQWRQIAVDSYADALRVVFIFQAALALLCLVACLPIQDNPLPGSPSEAEVSDNEDASDTDEPI
ncbi:MFS general substrate transporter [Mycena amicta]|nr:MFS general substrate transporter [Mycena amicta]